MPHLFKGDRIHLCPRKIIAEEILAFVGTDTNPEFWAYFADYDWVVLCQLFGTMIQLPGHFPMWCRDVKQLMSDLGIKREQLPQQTGTEHNALEDARWTRECLDYLLKEKEKYIRIPTVEEHYHDITKKKCGPTCPWPSYGRRATELSHDQGIWY
jgi:DNA polymerase III epsilon subunit-like protein